MDKIINTETMKQVIEDNKMTRNRLKEEVMTETNPYQKAILNKVHNDDIKTEQMIHWSILSELIKYIYRHFDMAPSLTVKPLEKDHLRKALTKCKYPKWALDKVEKRLNMSTRQVNDGGTNSAQSANNEVKNKGHIVIPTHKVFVKASKRSLVDMASKPTLKMAEPSKTYWSPPRTKTLCSTKVVPSIGTNMVT